MSGNADDPRTPDFRWVYEKGDLDQGAYSISDPERNKVAAILPADRARPIEVGFNAMLLVRPFGSQDWKDAGIHDFGGALDRGNAHAHQYRVQHQAAFTLDQVKREGLEVGGERVSKTRPSVPTPTKGRER